ncbi:hypothetical protein AB1K91_08230 [Terribacillus sp. 179-K 1B1 HS]|uniref:hypothetical protein n=1 Tax=Terribacillus sp. 179-K 1B1 HS TaxID=3142388 RepID=UPI0039A1DF05
MRITSIALGYTVCFLIVWRLLRLYKVKRDKNKINDEINNFDNAFLDGVYVIPRDPKEPRIKVRALFNYCKETGKKPADLSLAEMNRFLER